MEPVGCPSSAGSASHNLAAAVCFLNQRKRPWIQLKGSSMLDVAISDNVAIYLIVCLFGARRGLFVQLSANGAKFGAASFFSFELQSAVDSQDWRVYRVQSVCSQVQAMGHNTRVVLQCEVRLKYPRLKKPCRINC